MFLLSNKISGFYKRYNFRIILNFVYLAVSLVNRALNSVSIMVDVMTLVLLLEGGVDACATYIACIVYNTDFFYVHI